MNPPLADNAVLTNVDSTYLGNLKKLLYYFCPLPAELAPDPVLESFHPVEPVVWPLHCATYSLTSVWTTFDNVAST